MSRDLTSADLIALFEAAAATIEAQKNHLCELDGAIGDGDHGVTMSIGFTAVTGALAGLDPASASPTEVFNTAAKSFLNAVGASAGPLYATAFMRAGAAAKGKSTLDRDALVEMLAAMAQGMQHRGQAAKGDKTMLDAWLPASEAALAAREAGEDAAACLRAAAAAAKEGAEATRGMQAAKGRSSRLGERAVGHIDPGAASAALVLDAMAAKLASLG